MSSLSAHLRQPEDHSQLPFHPACPVCRRDRLAGSLDGEELVSRRTQAAIAAGLLAFSTVGAQAAVAAAQEPDEISEGLAEVVEGVEPDADVDLELDGEVLPVTEEAPVAATPPTSGDDDGVLEQDMATEIQGSGVDTSGDEEAVVPDEPAAAPEPAATPAPADVPEPTAEVLSEQDAGPVAPAAASREKAEPRPASAAPPRPAPAVAVPVATAPPAATPQQTTPVVARSSGSRADSGDRFHVVQPGESLWSIAADNLGHRATVARIAREVNRLWELNEELIDTGSPDLLFAGTRLRLR